MASPSIHERVRSAQGLIDLNDECLDALHAMELKQALLDQVNPELREIILNCNDISDVGAELLADALHVAPSLRSLNLYRNQISATGANSLGQALARKTCPLSALLLRRNQIGAVGAKSLMEGIAKNPQSQLQVLNVAENSLGDQGAIAIAALLSRTRQASSKSSSSSLVELNLEGNEIGPQGMRALAESLAHPGCALKHLYVSDNPIGTAGAAALAAALRSNRSLETLELNRCSIGSDGAAQLFEVLALQKHSSLRSLLLSGNSIGDKGVVACAKYLSAMAHSSPSSSVSSISSSSSKVSAATAANNHSPPKYRQSVTWLDISSNGMTAFGAKALAEALRLNPASLCQLYLGHSFAERQVGEIGAQALSKALAVNSSLQSYQGPGGPLLSIEQRVANRAKMQQLTSKL